jgi:hypothetical protein
LFIDRLVHREVSHGVLLGILPRDVLLIFGRGMELSVFLPFCIASPRYFTFVHSSWTAETAAAPSAASLLSLSGFSG